MVNCWQSLVAKNLSARQAGLKTVLTVNDYTRYQDFTDAILLLNHLGEPEQPFTVLAGNVPDANYMDMALVRRLHGSRSSKDRIFR
ncbi:MAG: hypothetical protein AB4352_07820 [Hormoscilla sp.]